VQHDSPPDADADFDADLSRDCDLVFRFFSHSNPRLYGIAAHAGGRPDMRRLFEMQLRALGVPVADVTCAGFGHVAADEAALGARLRALRASRRPETTP
jgi:hypothetical protein